MIKSFLFFITTIFFFTSNIFISNAEILELKGEGKDRYSHYKEKASSYEAKACYKAEGQAIKNAYEKANIYTGGYLSTKLILLIQKKKLHTKD